MKTLIFVVVLFLSSISIAYIGLTKHERAECLKFQDYAKSIPGWYATRAEKAMCDAYDIDLPMNKISRF